MTNSRLINEAQAAELLGMSVRTMQQWRWRKIGPQWLKMGRSVKYRISDLEAFVESCAVKQDEQSH